MGLAILLWGTSTVIGQNNCWVAPCEPNACDPCAPCGATGSPFTFGGWIETGIYVNNNGGGSDNGPMHTASNRRTDFLMNQLYFYGEREMNTKRGFDWGARADFVYGVDGPSMQCYDGTFDADWGLNRHGYAMSAYQVYGTLGYKNLSVMVGKFIGKVGWEASASKDNFFYTHSYCYWIEPATHTGVLATYSVTDRLTLNAGWTAGADSGFNNPDNNSTVLTGFAYGLTDKATVHYWINAGQQDTADYFVQSLCFEWALTKRFTHVFQYNLRNDNAREGGRYSSYGINNHFLYKLNEQWGAGMRIEWLRDNGTFGYITDDPGDYYQVTLGLNWNPWENVSIRPEVRYDWCKGATPFANETRKDQVTGGCGVFVSF